MLSLAWQRDARYLKRKDDGSSPFLACVVRGKERVGERSKKERDALKSKLMRDEDLLRGLCSLGVLFIEGNVFFAGEISF